MADATLIERLRAEREITIALDARRSVRAALPSFVQRARMSGMDNAQRTWAAGVGQVVGWNGFTAADVGGQGDAPQDYSAELWQLVAEDHDDWVIDIAKSVLAASEQRSASLDAAAGN